MAKTIQLRSSNAHGGKPGDGGDGTTPAWLLRQKVMLPDAPDGFVERPALEALGNPMQRRLTAFQAPGGFGKSTFLAEACRRERERGQVAAWLSLDDDDDAHALAAYLPFAFSAAGLEILASRTTSGDFERGDYRLRLLAHSIEVHAAPCLLALDEVDRLDAKTVAVVDWLVRNAPPNLHIALTCRNLPEGLDVATPVVEGRGVVVTVEDLRFAPREIGRFFGGTLSRRELAEVAETSRGWPIALWIHRNAGDAPASDAERLEIAANWFDARLMRGLAAEDRDLVLDAGLFDWLDDAQVDEVLGAGAMRRLRAIPGLAGLLQSAGGASGTAYLHPLLRQYCADRRFRETPERYRAVHRTLAGTLARASKIVPAMRHAHEAGEPRTAGEILERAGAWRLWFRHGVARLRAIDALMTEEIIGHFPRLAVLRCMALTVAGDLDAARRLFMELRARTANLSQDRPGTNDRELDTDVALFQCLAAFCGCAPIAAPGMAEMFAKVEALASDRDVEPIVMGAAGYAMLAVEVARTNLDEAVAWATRIRAELDADSRYFAMFSDLWTGLVAMARGRVAEASRMYARAQQTARTDFVADAGPTLIADVLVGELDLERNRTAQLARRAHKPSDRLASAGGWLDVFVAAAEAGAELATREGGHAAALASIDEALAFARRTLRVTFVRCLSALRVSTVVADGRPDDAARLWTEAGLPAQLADCAELATQTWREMEAVACAGLRLATAQGRFAEGRELADAVLELCCERDLVRTRGRVLALGMALEHAAGNAAGARAYLAEYLPLFADTGYVRSMVGERAAALAVLADIEEAGTGAALGPAADALRDALAEVPVQRADTVPALTPRENEILARLEHWQDKEIATALSLSAAGVRYHVSSLFRKLGVRGRFEAVHRARSMGLLAEPANDTG